MGFRPNTWTGQGRLDTIESYLANGPNSDTLTRQQIVTTGQNLVTQNYGRENIAGTTVLVDGNAYFMLVGLRAGDVVTNVSVAVVTAGSSVTLSKVGLYSTAGTRLALSADQGTNWQTAGLYTCAMATPYTVLTDGEYYAALVSKASVTLPALGRANSGVVAGASISSSPLLFGLQTGQTDLPASATIVGTSAATAFWVGVS
jgi:hypothetical protein